MWHGPYGSYRRDNYVCLECRHVGSSPHAAKCSHGHGWMVNMGRNFKAPRKRDDAAWRAVEQVARDRRGFGGSIRSPWSFPRQRPVMGWRKHRTAAELRQMDVPRRPVPGTKKGQWFWGIYDEGRWRR